MIQVETAEAVSTGFTHDLAPESVFIRSIRIPNPGAPVTARLSLPNGKRVALRGRVLRTYRAPAALSRWVPTGFTLRIGKPPEDYARFLATL